MLFNFTSLAIIAVLAGHGLATADTSSPPRLQRSLRRAPSAPERRQSLCQSDGDCPGSDVCCFGVAFGPGEGAGRKFCVPSSQCSGGACFTNPSLGFIGPGGSCDD